MLLRRKVVMWCCIESRFSSRVVLRAVAKSDFLKSALLYLRYVVGTRGLQLLTFPGLSSTFAIANAMANVRVSEWRKLPVSLAELCIDTTLRCGQSFRWKKFQDNEW